MQSNSCVYIIHINDCGKARIPAEINCIFGFGVFGALNSSRIALSPPPPPLIGILKGPFVPLFTGKVDVFLGFKCCQCIFESTEIH